MKPRRLLANISREYLANKKVYQYHMKKIPDMDDDEIIQKCHWFYEANNLAAEWNDFRKKAESEYRFCSYMEEYIEEGLCYDLQMIIGNCIKSSALPEINIDKEKCAKCCFECNYSL